MKKWKAILLIVVGVVLITIGVLCLIQSIYVGKLEYNTQLAELGYYKEDIHLLPYKYQVITGSCAVGVGIGLLFGLVLAGAGIIILIDY